ncbi:MAG: PD-(D/E)XK nuclease family protein [Rickettsiales bacterium]|jgi:ATP-dependent helicase/nuclease subunit B|nr:PD-(D/E)XK nuclease family protein [Rickettsiales bacterium]
MPVKSNIFCASNPARLIDALWEIIKQGGSDFSDDIIFLPSRRAARSVEKMLVEKSGAAVLLPTLVALGEGADEDDDDVVHSDVVSNTERVVVLAKLLSADANIRTISNALPIARDLTRMQDYLENEGIAAAAIDWPALVDEKYAAHFQKKAEFLKLSGAFLSNIFPNKITETQKRNADIRAWIKSEILNNKSKIIVCGSTGSVPATADLMAYVAGMSNGYIILPGKINCGPGEWPMDGGFNACNPYHCEKMFLDRISVAPSDVQIIDTGPSNMDFLNAAFSNSVNGSRFMVYGTQLVECARESEEAWCVAEIAARAVADNKTVLVITPDAAGNQRIAAALSHRGIAADFSGGKSGAMTLAGRALLNLFDDWIEDKNSSAFDGLYKRNDSNLFKTLVEIVETMPDVLSPRFQFDSDESAVVWDALEKTSDALSRNGIALTLSDARAVVADALAGATVRPPMNDGAAVCVLGTIESRMQSANVVVLTGLNEGMFPAQGYENSWLPRTMAQKIGLPPADRKVSLMALDFMNLSCGAEVYWLRSKTAGGSQTTESRFLSRIQVATKVADRRAQSEGFAASRQSVERRSQVEGVEPPAHCALRPSTLLQAVRARDEVEYRPLDYSPPRIPADRSDVYVTELELLIHNPYAFYARHILRLRPLDDYWQEPDARDFGNLVHGVIEECSKFKVQSSDDLIEMMDKRAKQILPAGSAVYHFWHKRFVEIAPAVEALLRESQSLNRQQSEIDLCTTIAGRRVRARADMVYYKQFPDSAEPITVALDIKTGAVPSRSQLEQGNMPQLPLEAHMIQSGGFAQGSGPQVQSPNVVMQFLQLKNNNVKLIEYDADATQKMIDAAVDKVSQLFGRYSNDGEPYEYYETSDPKYKVYDDLARVDD